MINLFVTLISSVLFANTEAKASDFETVWRAIEVRSPSLKSEISEKEASDIQVSRAKRHWLPRLMVNANVVSTNDPGTTLFSTLGSRSLLASDLNPSLMNDPSRQWFKRGAATLDWTLFEGGAKQSLVKGSASVNESHALSMAAKKNEIYSELVSDFGKLASLNSERMGLIELKEKLSKLVERYKVGSRDNPVGYSGLLGMRSLLNRLDSTLSQNQMESSALLDALHIRSGIDPLDLKMTSLTDAFEFTKEKFKKLKSDPQGSSIRVESMRRMATAQAAFSQAERARWLPRVGLFANENVIVGPRDTGTATEFGAYLQWELFNASHFGAYREASLRSMAFEHRSNEMAENSMIARRSLRSSLPMLEENLKRMRESMKITSEQVLVTEKLFRNGSVNALQLAEVLSRRADVIENQKQIEITLVSQLTEDFLQNVRVP
jgi:outer membrane protein TolC